MEQFDARMKSLLKDEYDDFKKALLEKPVKGLYLNRNKKNVERAEIIREKGTNRILLWRMVISMMKTIIQEEVLIFLQDFIISRNQVRCL